MAFLPCFIFWLFPLRRRGSTEKDSLRSDVSDNSRGPFLSRSVSAKVDRTSFQQTILTQLPYILAYRREAHSKYCAVLTVFGPKTGGIPGNRIDALVDSTLESGFSSRKRESQFVSTCRTVRCGAVLSCPGDPPLGVIVPVFAATRKKREQRSGLEQKSKFLFIQSLLTCHYRAFDVHLISIGKVFKQTMLDTAAHLG